MTSHRAAVAVSLVSIVSLVLSANAVAAPDKREQARQAVEEGTAAFALGKYSEAADAYELAFKLRPEAALLYNAAQARRLAGEDARALELYTNYVRVYRRGANRADALKHIENLKEARNRPRPARPVDPPPPTTPPIETVPAPALPPRTETPSTTGPQIDLTAKPTATDEPRPLTRQTWFWVAVGAGVLLAGGTVAFLATRKPKDPSAMRMITVGF